MLQYAMLSYSTLRYAMVHYGMLWYATHCTWEETNVWKPGVTVGRGLPPRNLSSVGEEALTSESEPLLRPHRTSHLGEGPVNTSPTTDFDTDNICQSPLFGSQIHSKQPASQPIGVHLTEPQNS